MTRRLVWACAVCWAVTSLGFVLQNVLPSDPALMLAGPQARPQDVEKIRSQLGLDRPLLVQYRLFVSRLVHLAPPASDAASPRHATCATSALLHVDLGKSFQQRRPVVEVLAERMPRSIALAALAVSLQALLGVASGVLASIRHNRALDRIAVGISLIGVSVPTYLIGITLQFVFAHKLGILPMDGFGTTFREHAQSIALPALTLGVAGAALYTRVTRDEMLALLHQDYVRTARAKGASSARVVIVHALRNALVPLVTVAGLDFGALVGGAIVTESLFRWPGIGALSVNAILDRDGPMIVGTVLACSLAVVVSTLLVDVCYGLLDPRVR